MIINRQPGSEPHRDLGQFTGPASPAVCIPNINASERRKRLLSGVVFLAFGLGVLAILVFTRAAILWRIILLPVFSGAAAGFFQWRDHT